MSDLMDRRVLTFWNRDQLEACIVPRLRVPTGGTVLDLGCGSGGLAIPLARCLPEARIVGIDREAGAIDRARALAETLDVRNVTFQHGDATALPLANGAADVTGCQTLLSHVPDAGAVLREMVRVTKPGGALLVVEYTNLGTFARADDIDAVDDIEERAWLYGMSQRYIEGKRVLGRGDDRIGAHVPLLLHDLGCVIDDVRLLDRAWSALPPYEDPRERLGLETMRTMTEGTPDTMRGWFTECFRAGGASDEGIERMWRTVDTSPWRRQAAERIADDRYRYVSAELRFVTIARTPVSR